MREQRHGADRAIGPVEQRRERVALGIAEVEFLGGHRGLPLFRRFPDAVQREAVHR